MNTQYREWLLDILIRCGDGEVRDTYLFPDFLNKAFEMSHIIYAENDDFQPIGYWLTPNATKYLERYK